ncbi:hypothetical protein JCM13664_14510 [Methylothermus subterraneus]
MKTFPLPSLDLAEIQQRMAFLELTEADAALLRQHRKALTRAAGQILDDFYAHLLKFPELQSLLAKSETLGHLKKVQRRYWQTLVSGRYDAQYVADRLKIGAAHQKAGLKLQWYTGAYAWFLSRLAEIVAQKEGFAPERQAALLGALIKLVFFDLSLAVETYVAADQAALEAIKTHLQRVLNTVPDTLLTLDAQGTIQACNPAAERLFGQPQGQLLGQKLNALLADEFDRPLAIHSVLTHLWRPGSAPLAALALTNQGQVPVEITVAPLPGEDLPCYLAVVRDVRRQKQAEQELLRLAQFDPLTALPNRSLFLDRLAQEVARACRHRSLLAVLFLDLDDFKHINDSFGHLSGDLVLKQVAQRLKKALRKTDTVARFGGDEFVLCLPDLKSPEEPLPIATKLLETFAAPFRLETQEVFVKASVGIALYPHHGSDPHTLLKHADAAMYEAKRQRLGPYCYNAALEHAAIHKLTLEGELHRALEREEFYLVYQPQVDLRGRIAGVEALLRWRNPSLGEVPPARFIPCLEHSGLIFPVGEWVFQTACAQLKQWQESLGVELTLAVNVSARQIAQPDFPEIVYRELVRFGIDPARLELEVTENTLLEPSELVVGNLETLRAMGVLLAIDDFGTGYSSLGCLKRFPFRTLKIDKSFIQHLETEKDLALASHLVGIGKSLGLCVVAEGVETKPQLDLVLKLGCDRVQGYFFSPPLEPQKLSPKLKAIPCPPN